MDDATDATRATPLESVVEAYDAAWRATDSETRLRLLERALVADAELIGPEPVGRHSGVTAIASFIGGFVERWPGTQVVVTTAIDAHHGWVRYGWAIREPGGGTRLEGIDVAELAPDGRMQRVVMFYGTPPERAGT